MWPMGLWFYTCDVSHMSVTLFPAFNMYVNLDLIVKTYRVFDNCRDAIHLYSSTSVSLKTRL